MPIDHLAAGVLAPHLSTRELSAQVFGVSLLASILPDVPIIISGWKGSIDYLSHRGASHSLLLAPALALLPFALVFLISRGQPEIAPLQLYLISLTCYCLHIFMDLVTPFGTQILYPLSRKQFSLDIFHSFDPAFMAVSAAVLGTFILATRNKTHLSPKTVTYFIALYILYTGFTVFQKTKHGNAFRREIESANADFSYMRTIPRTFWRWKGVAQNNSDYLVAVGSNNINIKGYSSGLPASSYLTQQREVSKFMDYARYPILEHGDGRVELHNLIYSPESYRLTVNTDANQSGENFTLSGFDLRDREY